MRILTIILLIFNLSAMAQFQTPQWEMPIYFEDALGERDTIWIGFDERASVFPDVIDTIFDENYKKVDTSKFVVHLSAFWLKEDSLTKRRIMSVENPSKELYSPIYFLNGTLPIKMYWDANLLNSDSFPFNVVPELEKGKMWIPNVLGAGYMTEDTSVACCFHCYFASYSDSSYSDQDWECYISDSVELTTNDNNFYSAETGIGEISVYIVPLSERLNVGLKEAKLKNFKIYPNPVRERLILERQSKSNHQVNARLYTINGQMMDEFNISGENTIINRDISGLESGIFILKLTFGNLVEYHRIIKY